MGNAGQAMGQIHKIEEMAEKDQWLNRVHPLVKLCVTIYYMILVASFSKYNISGLLSMSLYLVVLYITGEVPFWDSLYRLRLVLPLVSITGALNPFFDRVPIAFIGNLTVTGGMASMLTLLLKGVFTVLGAYLLIASTPMPKICAALRMLHVPKIIVTVILLLYRYLSLLLEEAERVTQAYALRAPGQKGIRFRAWGTLAGQMLLRTIDRAQNVYDSMSLRGFCGEFYFGEVLRLRWQDVLYLAAWAMVLTALRILPVFELAGNFLIP